MRPALAVLLLATGCGGSSFEGTWRVDTSVSNGMGMVVMSSEDFLLLDSSGLVWRVGGGCDAPLTKNGNVAALATANWTCPLQSSTGLPFESVDHYQWTQGDVLQVKNATFTQEPNDQLAIDFSLIYRTDPNDPTVGPTVDFTHKAGGPYATRVK